MLSDGVNEPNKYSISPIIIVAIDSYCTYGTAETFYESTVRTEWIDRNNDDMENLLGSFTPSLSMFEAQNKVFTKTML